MTPVDILFWLLLALMGGLIWAVEAGLGHRYRALVSSSILASLGSALIIMFVIEDNTKLTMKRAVIEEKKGGEGEAQEEEALGEVDFGNKKKKRRAGGGGGSGPGPGGAAGGAAGADANKNNANAKDGPATINPEIEYSREPFKDCPQCPEIIIMSVGKTVLGSRADEEGRADSEIAQKEVAIEKPFAIGRLEVTRQEFAEFVKDSGYQSPTQCDMPKRKGVFNWSKPGFEQDSRHAVVCVSIADVKAYIDWLSTKSGRNYDLPTEVEWEYAARAGSDTPYWTGTEVHRTQANIGRTRDGTTPTGLFTSNRFGLADVIGNVWEMTGQCVPEPKPGAQTPNKQVQPDAGKPGAIKPTATITSTPAPATHPVTSAPPATTVASGNTAPGPIPTVANGQPPAAGIDEAKPCRRYLKGGGWNASAAEGRHAARMIFLDGGATNFIGFRVVRAVDERDKDLILTEAEKLRIAKAEELAAEIEAKEREALEKARHEGREAKIKAELETNEMKVVRAKAKAEHAAKIEADQRAKFREEQAKKDKAKK